MSDASIQVMDDLGRVLIPAVLHRKARGKVAEDYEKSKAKKKAAMDAKKNALRAEDMATGVFVPVSHLPKQEPKKASLAV